MKTSVRYFAAACRKCGSKDSIRSDYWHKDREYWCDECGEERRFRLTALLQISSFEPGAGLTTN